MPLLVLTLGFTLQRLLVALMFAGKKNVSVERMLLYKVTYSLFFEKIHWPVY